MTITKKCAVCGAEFEAQRSSARFCSNRCRQRKKRGVYAPVFAPSPPDVSVKAAPVECEAIVQEAHRVANDLARLSRTGPPRLQPRFARVSSALDAALREEGL